MITTLSSLNATHHLGLWQGILFSFFSILTSKTSSLNKTGQEKRRRRNVASKTIWTRSDTWQIKQMPLLQRSTILCLNNHSTWCSHVVEQLSHEPTCDDEEARDVSTNTSVTVSAWSNSLCVSCSTGSGSTGSGTTAIGFTWLFRSDALRKSGGDYNNEEINQKPKIRGSNCHTIADPTHLLARDVPADVWGLLWHAKQDISKYFWVNSNTKTRPDFLTRLVLVDM